MQVYEAELDAQQMKEEAGGSINSGNGQAADGEFSQRGRKEGQLVGLSGDWGLQRNESPAAHLRRLDAEYKLLRRVLFDARVRAGLSAPTP